MPRPDDALSVYYVKRNKAGKLDNKRDQYDKAVGVVTYTPRYQGPFAPGDGLDSGSDQDCAPLDSQVAPDGGKRRVSVCRHASGKRAIELIYMSSASPSRDGQTISQLGIFAVGLGEGLYDSLLRAALEDLGCEDPSCGGSG